MSNEVEILIRNAQKMRDYAVLSGNVQADELVKSLTPFDLNATALAEDKVVQLQLDMARVAKAIDTDTRHAVLLGRFRSASTGGGQTYVGLTGGFWESVSAVFLVGLGAIVLSLLITYSVLAAKGAAWVAEVTKRGAVDYMTEMTVLHDIVLLPSDLSEQEQITAAAAGPLASSLTPPDQNFLVQTAKLRAMMARDDALLDEAIEIQGRFFWCDFLGGKFPPVQHLLNALFSTQCYVPESSEPVPSLSQRALDQAKNPEQAVLVTQEIDRMLREVELARSYSVEAADDSRIQASKAALQLEIARKHLSENLRLIRGTLIGLNQAPAKSLLLTTSLRFYNDYRSQVWTATLEAVSPEDFSDPLNYGSMLSAQEQEIKGFLNVINGWVLPILFGALGSIVLCLTRTASRFYAAPSVIRILARLAVAMLGGALISALFAPTYFADGVKANSSFVFVLCFIFGYSTPAFVTLLDNIASKLAGTKV